MINVAVPETTTAIRTSAAVEKFNQSSLAVVAADLSHTTVTLRFAAVAKSIARKADPVVVIHVFTTLRCLYAVITGHSTNGVGHHAVGLRTIIAKVIYAATVKLSRKCTVRRVVVP